MIGMEWKLTYFQETKKKKEEKKEILNLFYQPPFEDLELDFAMGDLLALSLR